MRTVTQHLCMVIHSLSGDVLAEYEIEADHFYYARHQAALKYEESQKYQPNLRKLQNWYVDSCEID